MRRLLAEGIGCHTDLKRYLNSKDEALYRAIGEILQYVWDPIGVAGVPQARDEYNSYVPQVFSLVRSGASAADIAAHLARVASDDMGRANTVERAREAASVLVDWRDFIRDLPPDCKF